MPGRYALYLLVGLGAGVHAATAVKSQELKLPLEFEANRGQFAPEVLFLARTPNHFVYLTRYGMTLGLSSSVQRGAALQMKLVDANASAKVQPEDRVPGISNYFIGNDPARWQRVVPHYGRIRYRAVWPGIDLVFHGCGEALEYDFAVSPGADPSAIRLNYANAGRLRLEPDGSLVIETTAGQVVQRPPEIYQESAGIRKAVPGRFRIAGNREVRFEVGAYDRRRPLVIDPTVTYSTYIGASGTAIVSASAVDGSGNLYLAGTVSSPDYPTVNAIQQFSTNVGLFRSTNQGTTWGSPLTSLGTADVLALATDPTAPAVAYAGTSRGLFKTTNSGASFTASNSGMENAAVVSVAVDPLSPKTLYACQPGNLYKSTDSGATWKAILNNGCTAVAPDPKNEGEIWIGSSYNFPIVSLDGGATYLNTYHQVLANAVAIDPTNSNNVFFGTTNEGLVVSSDGGITFKPITTGLAATQGSSVNVNAIAIDRQNATRVLVGTDTGVYLSASGGLSFQATSGIGTRRVLSLLIDPNTDSIVLAGTAGGGVYRSTDGGATWAPDGPANLDVNALAMSSDEQTTFAALYSGSVAYITKINPSGTAILYSSFLGGGGATAGYGLGVDAAGHAFLCGSTNASDYPTQNPYQARNGGGTDMFVSRLSASGSALEVSTFLGGRATDSCYALALDASGNVYVTGTTILINATVKSDFPTTPGVLGKQSFGGQDCVIAKFDNSLQTLIYSTFLGGGSAESCYAIAADSSGNAYVTGITYSPDFLVTQPPFGGTHALGSNTTYPAFAAKIKPDGSSLIYSALLGGVTGFTRASGIVADRAGRAYVTGYTSGADYPVTANALNKTLPPRGVKTVVTAIETDGSKLVYSTFLSGSGHDGAFNLALDANNTAWITGTDLEGLLPATSDALPVKPAATASSTPFLVGIDSTGSNLLHATYLGGTAGGVTGPVAVGPDGSVYVAGTTLSTDFTLTGTPFQKPQTADFHLYLLRLVFSTSGGGPVGGTVPAITSVQNGASFQNGFAPGAWMTIKGTNLASVTDTWDNAIVNNQLPTTLDGVKVSVGGQPAYVYFVSPGQINVVVPNVQAGSVNVVVTNSQGPSAPFSVTAQAVQPAFFLWNNTYAVATRQDFSYAAKDGTFTGLSTIPARPGDVIILWGTGFGPTNPAAPAGVQTPASPFPTANPVTVTIGNQSATVFGAALAPGFAALYQVAIQIPASLADGDYPVVATVLGQSSPATSLITVQH